MDNREYLKSLGFEVGSRGRFSADMLEALSKRDPKDYPPKVEKIKVYKEPVTSEPKYVAVDIPLDVKLREPSELLGYTAEGDKVQFITCFRCSKHMMYCKCSKILAPSIVSRCDSALVEVR